MNNLTKLSLAAKLTILGLVLGAAGISTLFLTNSVSAPPIPIGPILLLAAAALIALGPWRWTPIPGVAISLAILVGAFIAYGLFDRLSHLDQAGAFTGTWIQMVGLIIALIAGVIATIQNYQPRPQSTSG
jgi:hypothetical protein